jgi:hypothetical protein
MWLKFLDHCVSIQQATLQQPRKSVHLFMPAGNKMPSQMTEWWLKRQEGLERRHMHSS